MDEEHIEQIDSESEPFELCDRQEPTDVIYFADEEDYTEATVSEPVWQTLVDDSDNRFRATHSDLLLPWETGASASLFNDDVVTLLPECIAFEPSLPEAEMRRDTVGPNLNVATTLDVDCKFSKIVKNLPDLEYFEQKSQSLELACGRWLELLSITWDASNVGQQLVMDLHEDSSGATATVRSEITFNPSEACWHIQTVCEMVQ